MTSVVVAGVIGLAVTLNVMQQQQTDEFSDRQATTAETAASRAKSSPAAADSVAAAPAAAPALAELAIRAPAAPVPAAPVASVAMSPERSQVAPAENVTAPAAATAAEAFATKKASSELLPAAPPFANQTADVAAALSDKESIGRAKAELSTRGVVSAQAASVEREVAANDLEQKLKQIRDLARAGKHTEASELIRQLQHRDPTFVLPEDIEALLAASPGKSK
ncbi:MAG: hypothetical protein IPG34_14675 [Rhodocyclaceae bacterium]|nr:hypothetical protein [Rhodocyclaceae bacterium]